jgi:hypothetical protein
MSTIKDDAVFDALVLCSDETFLTRRLDDDPVEHPSYVVEVTHDVVPGGGIERAHASLKSPDGVPLLFKTGRPNYRPPEYKKFFTIEVNDRDILRRHVAEFIVTGDYDLGAGASFALPTYEPILVLRDPPGGLSTASYTNVQTTIAVTTENMQVMSGFDAGVDLGVTFANKVSGCAGGGFGVLFLVCSKLQESNTNVGGGASGGADFVAIDKTDTYTGKYTTTWSYTTSDDPLHAGRLSDTMVVPNLNVEYHSVWDIQFDSTIYFLQCQCSPNSQV